MCNIYSITTNQAAIAALFRVVNRYVGNLAPMLGVFPDYPAPVVRNTGGELELTMMRWGMPPPPRAGGYPVTNIRNTSSLHWLAVACTDIVACGQSGNAEGVDLARSRPALYSSGVPFSRNRKGPLINST